MKTLLVPIDFSATSEHALVEAVDLADKLDAKIHLLHVIPLPRASSPELRLTVTDEMMSTLIGNSQAALDRVAETHRGSGRIAGSWLRHGDARTVILEAASELAIDMIVMGTHGRRGLARAILGSVAESVVRGAACPVLLIRSPKGPHV